MRRTIGLFLLLAGFAPPALAQTGLSVVLSLDSGGGAGGPQMPIVTLRNLTADERWTEALDNSLPIIVTHRLELWRSRQGWIDEFSGSVEWRVFVTKEPLQEEYTATLVLQDRPQRPRRFAVRDSAFAWLQRPNLVQFSPTRRGRYYYTLTTRITTLSDADMDQLERFLAGDPELAVPDRGTMIGRGVRRFLLRIAGLPSVVLAAKSVEFDVTRDDR
jgi:hypothetical protein